MNITLLRESFALVTERSPQVVTRFYEIHEEATPSLRRGFGRGDELQRDLSIERRIATEIDVPHAALPEDAVDHESVEGGGRASPLDRAVLRLRDIPVIRGSVPRTDCAHRGICEGRGRGRGFASAGHASRAWGQGRRAHRRGGDPRGRASGFALGDR